MGLRFVIGRAGTGKTRRCFDAIESLALEAPLGPPIYWLLPRQATFTAERLLTCGSKLKGFCRVRVVSFEELGREILAECGGVAIPQVTAIGRQMVLGHLLRQKRDELKFFRSVAHQAGLASELDGTFAEFERSGKTADDLERLVRELESDQPDDALSAKLHDLHLLYTAYAKYLGQERLDPHRRLMQVLDCISHSTIVRRATVFVDGFYEFTDYERKFLAALAKSAADVEITLTLDPNSKLLADPHTFGEELGMFHLIEETYRKLYFAMTEAEVELEKPVVLRSVHRFDSPSIKHLEACLFSQHAKTSDDHRGIELIDAPDRRAEVDAAARQVQRLVADGCRMRDVAVLVRDMDAYHELIDASFREHRLPWFVDRRRSALHHPLIQFVRSLPTLALHEFDHDAAMTILKTGLIDLGSDDDAKTGDLADELENYVLRHRIHGTDGWLTEKPWTFHRQLLGREAGDDSDTARRLTSESREMNALRRRFIDPLLPFLQTLGHAIDSPVPLKSIVAELHRLFDACKVDQTLSRWIRAANSPDDLEQQAEHAQVWNELIELLDQLVELLGDEPVHANDFIEILESGLESFDLALTPPTVDQVLVGSVDRTRTPPVKAVIVLGLHEGGFPRCAGENSILCDAERKLLRSRKVEIDNDTQRRLFDERYLAYIAFTRASQTLILTRPLADDAGRPLAPSSYWTLLRSIFPRLEPTTLPRDARRNPDCIGTPRQLVTSLLRWARTDEPGSDHCDSTWAALYASFREHRCCDDAIDTMRFRAWRALSYRNDAVLSPEVAQQLVGEELRASVSRMETFATCPFKHFVRYGLRLEERDDEEVTALDLGNVYHGILENLVREMVKQRQDFTTAPQLFTDEQIKLYAQEIGQSLRSEVLLSTARNKYLLQHVEKTLSQVVDTQREGAKRGKFKPWKTELVFGRDGVDGAIPGLTITTPLGRHVVLNGKIDRVDVLEDQTAFAVIDYKLSGSTLSLRNVYHGLSLQLLTYLLVVRSSQNLAPAAAFYVKLLRKLEAVKHPEDAAAPDKPAFHLKQKPRGIVSRKYLEACGGALLDGRSEVLNAAINANGSIRRKCDAVEQAAFDALLKFVERRIGELADEIIGGSITVKPYRDGTSTPCPNCGYRSVCRFDPARDGYRFLDAIEHDDVIAKAIEAFGGQPDA